MDRWFNDSSIFGNHGALGDSLAVAPNDPTRVGSTAPIICPGDVNGDAVVNMLDLLRLLICFGLPADPGCESEDVNGDGVVNVPDLLTLLAAWGPCQ